MSLTLSKPNVQRTRSNDVYPYFYFA